MKVCTIEIDKKRVILTTIEKIDEDDYIDHTGKFTSIALNDDLNHQEILSFTSALHTHFDSLSPDRIVILKRSSKGRFAASSLSFKIEGLIQTYAKVAIEFISPQTLSAYYKKNEFKLSVKYNYQAPASHLAFYVLNQ